MTDDLHRRFAEILMTADVDAGAVARGAMARGRRRRLNRRGAAGAAGVAAGVMMLALPALAGSGAPRAVDTAGEGTEVEHDLKDTPGPDSGHEKGGDDVKVVTTTTETPPTTEKPAPVDKPDEWTTTTHEQKPEPKPEPTPTTAPKPVPSLEELHMECGRGDVGVVCEWSLSEREDFAAYRLYRGCPEEACEWSWVWTYEQRSMPDRPWPDIRYVDETAGPESAWYFKAVVVDAEGNMIGRSNKVLVPAAVG